LKARSVLLAPEPRRQLRAALRDLARERGDIKHWEGPLKDYFRLRIRDYRIVFQYAQKGKSIQCVFAERRELIYEIFERLIRLRLFGEESE
jgi:mRNA-degrading endonuclease RelE of RelBE toxin-antitoxin system